MVLQIYPTSIDIQLDVEVKVGKQNWLGHWFRRRRHILFGNALAATQGLCAAKFTHHLIFYLKAISKQQCLWPQLQMSSSGNYRVRIGSILLVLVRPY